MPPFYGEKNASRDTVADCDDADCDTAMARWAVLCTQWVQGRYPDSERIVGAIPWAAMPQTRGWAANSLVLNRNVKRGWGRALV